MLASCSTGSDSSMSRRARLKPWMVTAVAPIAAYLLLDAAARFALWQQGWFDSWEYATRVDPELGYRMRPRMTNKLGGVVTHTNADGFRAAEPKGNLSPKKPGELLVAVVGDSNTFGVGVPYEQTFPALLQAELQARTRQPARVENLGVVGYSLVQSFLTAKNWGSLDPDVLIVTADSFNNRVFVGRPDSALAYEQDAGSRAYEYGEFISYPLLYLRRRAALKRAHEAPPPELRNPIPVPRVPMQLFESVLLQVAEFAKQHSIKLVLLTTAQATESERVDAGFTAWQEKRYEEALAAFGAHQEATPAFFLSAYYAYHSAASLGFFDRAQAIRDRYVASAQPIADRYQLNMSHFACEYEPIVRRVAELFGLPVVDLRAEFRAANVKFSQGHYDAVGHALVARGLAASVAAIAQSVEERGSRDPDQIPPR